MNTTNDPFERAVKREGSLRRRAALIETRSGAMRLALGLFGTLLLGWASAIAVHWKFFAEPRWLVVLHTMAFVLVGGYWVVALVAMKFILPRDTFEDE